MSIDTYNNHAWEERVDNSDDEGGNQSNESHKPSVKDSLENSASKDIREHMNIKHFEEIQRMFFSHVNEDGSSGFALDMVHTLERFPILIKGSFSKSFQKYWVEI